MERKSRDSRIDHSLVRSREVSTSTRNIDRLYVQFSHLSLWSSLSSSMTQTMLPAV